MQKAYQNGMTFLIPPALYGQRSEDQLCSQCRAQRNYIASKTLAKTEEEFWEQLHQSLDLLKTDYLDIYRSITPISAQNPATGPDCMKQC